MSIKNRVEKKLHDLTDKAKQIRNGHDPKKAPQAPDTETETPSEPARRTAQSINDEDRAASEGMGQSKYGPPPSLDRP